MKHRETWIKSLRERIEKKSPLNKCRVKTIGQQKKFSHVKKLF